MSTTATVENDHVISVHYTLTEVDGDLLDSSEGQEPLIFIAGHGNIIAGLEEALIGKEMGDEIDITIKPEDAYGPIQEEAIHAIPLTAFEDVEDLEVGMRFHLQSDQGPAPVTVTHIEDGMVTIDPHHPFAGKTLHFLVHIADIRKATEAELQNGHVQTV
ncbi:MAG: peptidylprolyl isomerase [Pseudomonadales bacterium]|nr:peptidylprolyl isomerase [Pseudomonadales bacterium]